LKKELKKENVERVIDMVFANQENLLYLFSSIGGIYKLDLNSDSSEPVELIYDLKVIGFKLEFSEDHKWALIKKKIEQKKKNLKDKKGGGIQEVGLGKQFTEKETK
jgi:hypothetical protein